MHQLTTCLWFDGDAEEAAVFYTSIFKDGRIGRRTLYGKEGFEIHGQKEGNVLTVEFEMGGQSYLGLNGGPQFKFNESVSIIVNCKDQGEVDYYWSKLLEGGGEEGPCGWLKDKFGLSWQVVPVELNEMLYDPDLSKTERLTKCYLQMKKFDIKKLKEAFEGK